MYEMVCRQAPVAMLILSALLLCPCVSSGFVGKCPRSKAEWERESALLDCQEPYHYHCLKDNSDHLLQLCSRKIWIPKGKCPEYNSYIDVSECSSPSCPQSVYWSNAVYLYPVCYGPKTETTPQLPRPTPWVINEPAVQVTSDYQTTPEVSRSTPQILTKPEVLVTSDYQTNTTLKKRDIDNGSTGSLRRHGSEGSTSNIVGVSIAGALVVLAAALVLVFFFRKRKRRNRCNRDSNQANAHQQGNIDFPSQVCINVFSIRTRMQSYTEQNRTSICVEEENELNSDVERETLLHCSDVQSSGISENGSSLKDGCQVYIPEGPGTRGQFIDSTRILVLVPLKTSEINKIIEECKGTFGRKYIHCCPLAVYSLKPKQEQKQEATDLLKDFDFKTSGVEAILKKLIDVVSSVTSMAFVVTIPSDVWSLNREKITAIIDKDYVFKRHYI